jgi:hypothetical protein
MSRCSYAPDNEKLPDVGDDIHVNASPQPFQITINVLSTAYSISATISKRGLKFCPLGSPQSIEVLNETESSSCIKSFHNTFRNAISHQVFFSSFWNINLYRLSNLDTVF